MSTNFFTQIAQMNIEGNLQINIQPNETEYIVSVLLQNDHCGDNAKNLIPPLVLKGTAEALDIGFLEKVMQPLEQSSNLMVNMESYLKAQEEARKQSAMEKEKAEKERKAKEERTKKFQKAMEKAEKLEQEKQYRKAWTAVPNIEDFPEFADKIRKRKKELSDQFEPNLFQ